MKKRPKPPPDPLDYRALAEHALHPIQVTILRTLAHSDPYSPVELAHLFDEPLGNVSYHMRVLADGGFVKCVRERPVRGAVEHFYALTPKALT